MEIRFGPFTLDEGARELRRDAVPIHLSPKALDLLLLLVRRRPAAIAKAEIHRHLWPDTFVSDVSLAVLVAEIRTALGETSRQPTFVRTVHRHGYAFSGAPLPEASCWLMWRGRHAPLRNGENVIGRDPAADVRIDAVGVSRRHAMIVVIGDAATLHDLGSKNGTFVDGVRISSEVSLADGSEVALGPAPVVFRTVAELGSTHTWNASKHGA